MCSPATESFTPKDKTPPLATALPPWHAGVFVASLFALSLATMPKDLDAHSTIETFTRRVFPELMSLQVLAITRLAIAASFWLLTFYIAFFGKGWDIRTTYKPDSKLRNTTFHMGGWNTLCPFTTWCWLLLTANFTVSGYIALMAHWGKEADIEKWVLRWAYVCWELSAPFALLVSAVVRYAIWPAVLATKRPHTLAAFRNQMQHNLNSVFALSEMALFGGLPIQFSHISFSCFVGAVYIVFTWLTCYVFAAPEMGPQYLYWFMDPTRGKSSTFALVALLFVLILSFVIFCAIEAFIDLTGSNLLIRIACVLAVSSAVVKTS